MERIIVPRKTLALPKTGQTTSYQDYDDGYYEYGQNSPAVRYVDNTNGTITDQHTGLMWAQEPQRIIPGATGIQAQNQIQDANAKSDWANETSYLLADLAKDTADSTYWVCVVAHTSDAAGVSATFALDRATHASPARWRETVWTVSATDLISPSSMSWANCLTNCYNLAYAGYDDWRVPNIKELDSLVDYGQDPLCINSTFFPNTVNPGFYWSSTTSLALTTSKYRVLFTGGDRSKGNEVSTYYIRPVRGGIS